jgi:23S rRNA pseudouridine955/2504/2580 synthase/23S rRNA pseudouridine1911/1915/1917 synthase
LDYVAVFKPAGLATIPGRGEADSVFERLAAQLGLAASGSQDPRLRVVHRLDKETSGALLFATNVEAQRNLSHQFQNNLVEKEYVALVAGRPAEMEGEIDSPLARHPTSPQRMVVAKRGGRPARTLWKVEELFRSYSLLRVFPRTGKTHQIRVHLAHIGLPLAIDPLYHPAGARTQHLLLSSFKRGYRHTSAPERPLMDRLTLHAQKLRFHDRAERQIQIEASLPKDFRATLNMLCKYGR